MKYSWLTKQTGITLILLFSIDIIFFFLAAASFIHNLNAYLSLFLTIVMVILAGYTIKYLTRLEKGTDGEDAVRRILKELPGNYICLNDFNYNNRSSIDIVVIGPTGIFTLEVKNYFAKNITYNNDILIGDGTPFRKNILHQAYSEMKNMQDLLAINRIIVPIYPVLIFTNRYTKIRFGLHPIRGVYVVGISWLLKIILEREYILTNEQINSVHKLLKPYTSII